MATEKKRTVDDMSMAEREALIAKPIADCTAEDKDLKLLLLEERVKGIIATNDLTGLGPNDEVMITVPLMPDNNMFQINNNKYYGRVKVTRDCADTLMCLISNAYQIEKERLQSRGNGSKNPDGKIRGVDSAVVERYNQMMG